MKPDTHKLGAAMLARLHLTRFTAGQGRPNDYAA